MVVADDDIKPFITGIGNVVNVLDATVQGNDQAVTFFDRIVHPKF